MADSFRKRASPVGLFPSLKIYIMAIIFPTLGKMKGSIGNITTRKHYAVATRVIASQKASEVKNPKSLGQAQQRLKLSPLVKVYSHLQPIICHSFQGLTYGMSNYAAYLKTNMNAFAGPYVVKGVTAAVPGAFVISRGSIPVVRVSVANTSQHYFSTSINLTGFAISSGTTIGTLAAAVIAQNSGISDGDQLTFIAAIHSNGDYAWGYQRIILSTADTTLLSASAVGGLLSVNTDQLCFEPYDDMKASETLICGGVIVSRYSDSQNTWLRSSCKLTMFELSNTYFGATAYQNAVDSYMSKDVPVPTSSSWYLNGATEDNEYGFYSIVKGNKPISVNDNTISNEAIAVSVNGDQSLLAMDRGSQTTYDLLCVGESNTIKNCSTGFTIDQINTAATANGYKVIELASSVTFDELNKYIR